ncbi:MAG: folylpolyglutamate synthase/dihydrofolate synthase family protein [Limisphaerales bacterium]
MTYAEALEYLEGLGRFGLRPGLETVTELAARAGHPEAGLAFLHVAGTNGKGSTCAFLESLCREAGLRVGLYTSPHLQTFRERIQVDREPIPEFAVAEWLGEARGWMADGGSGAGSQPTFFELVTVLALAWFARTRCDVVIWETGLGGRLDATNLVNPRVSAVTNIGWDHMEWLGRTLPEIAREKAGIFKPGIPAVTTERDPAIVQVLRQVADRVGAPFRQVGEDDPEWEVLRGVALPLAGEHQRWNAVLALAMLEAAGWRERFDGESLRRGLMGARWPGRFQVVPLADGRTLVLDGAHNASGFETLALAMAEVFPGRRFGLLIGMLADKEPGVAGAVLARGASRVVLVPVSSNRGGDPAVLAGAFRGGLDLEVEVAPGLAEALKRLAREELVLVTGSLYLVGEALDWLGRESGNERRLNDWRRSP